MKIWHRPQEKDLKQSQQLFDELQAIGKDTVDLTLDNKCIDLAIRVLAAKHVHSPQHGKLDGQLGKLVRERNAAASENKKKRESILKKIAAINGPYITACSQRLLQEALSLHKQIKSEQISQATYDVLTDKRTAEYKSNQSAIEEAVEKINRTKSEILGMQSGPLQEIIDTMRDHEQWFYELVEIQEVTEPLDRFELTSQKGARLW